MKGIRDKGKPFVDLVNVDKIKINVNVPELDVRYLKIGQKTMVRVDAFPGRELFGVIDSWPTKPTLQRNLSRQGHCGQSGSRTSGRA